VTVFAGVHPAEGMVSLPVGSDHAESIVCCRESVTMPVPWPIDVGRLSVVIARVIRRTSLLSFVTV